MGRPGKKIKSAAAKQCDHLSQSEILKRGGVGR